jgi:Lipase (class 3)
MFTADVAIMNLSSVSAVSGLLLMIVTGCSGAEGGTGTDTSDVAIGGTKVLALDLKGEQSGTSPSAQNAYWTARLSEIVYLPLGSIPAKLKEIGVVSTLYVPFANTETDAQGFYLRTATAGFLVFRGSEKKVRDWSTNFDFIRKVQVGPQATIMHSGFQRAVDSVWPTIRKQLDVHAGASALPLYITGHSLGGAMAVYATYKSVFDGCLATKVPGDFGGVTKPWADSNIKIDRTGTNAESRCLASKISVTATYTFGQPAVGNNTFADELDARLKVTKTAYFRYVNANDPIPSAAAVGLVYPHIGNPSASSPDSHLAFLSPCGALVLGNQAGRDGLPASIPDHNMDEYYNKILGAAAGKLFKGTSASKCKP